MFEGIPAFDAIVMEWVQTHAHNPVTDAVFPIVTKLGEYGLIWIAAAILLLCFKKTRTTGRLVLISMLLALLFGELVLKNIVCRPRPCTLFPDFPMLIARPSSYSFPSGHSASGFAAAVTLALCHKKWGWLALLPAALIAFSRVFLFVHFPTDVLAGALLGTLFAIAVYWVYRKRAEGALRKS